jgi:hypothetical protein
MGFQTRLQLVNLDAAEAALADMAMPRRPPGQAPLDDVLAQAFSQRTKAPAVAARAIVARLLENAARALPDLVLRNIAVTHVPLHMPDDVQAALSGLEYGSMRSVLAPYVPKTVAAAVSTRLDNDDNASCGAWFSPAQAAEAADTLHRALAAGAPTPLAALLGLFRAAQRAGLAVCECMLPAGDRGALSSSAWLHWPGVPVLLQHPLMAGDWHQLLDGVSGVSSLSPGDFDDLVLALVQSPVVGEARTVAHMVLIAAAARVQSTPGFCAAVERALDDVDANSASNTVQRALLHVQLRRHTAVSARPGPAPDVLLRVAALATEEHAIALVTHAVQYGLLDAAWLLHLLTRLSATLSRKTRARLAMLLQDAPPSVRNVLDEAPAPTRVFAL